MPRVMLVEDDEPIAFLIKDALKHEGLKVDVAAHVSADPRFEKMGKGIWALRS